MQQFADRLGGVTGSEIRKIFALLEDPDIISFAGGNPNPDLFPAECLAEIGSQIIKTQSATVLQYGGTPGLPSLLSMLREKNSDIMQEYDDIIVTSGSSQGIEMFCRTFLNPGDTMLAEAPSFIGALQTFKLAQANIVQVDMEDDGVDTVKLEQAIKANKPKFFYIIPTFQNPSGISTSAEKRRKIYALCKANDVMILEDDPYAELRFEGKPIISIKSMDDCGLVCKLSSFSKTISPGLRVGYAVAHRDIIQKFNLIKQGQDVHTGNLSQAMVYEFIARGFYEDHVALLCREYKAHRDAMLQALESNMPSGCKWTHPAGGLFIWLTLPEGMDAGVLFERCVECKVAYVPGSPFYAAGGHANTLRLNFSMPSIPMIESGVKKMSDIIRAYA